MVLLKPDRRRGPSLVMIVKHVHALPLNFKLLLLLNRLRGVVDVVAVLGAPRKQVVTPNPPCRLLEITEPLFS